MGPAELAALVAREADAGVATALAAADVSGAFVLEEVVARVRTVVPGETGPTTPANDDREWEAEFHLRHAAAPVAALGDGGVPPAVARLGVRSVRGVGPHWEKRLEGLGVRTVGELAAVSPAALRGWGGGPQAVVLLAQARACAGGWPRVDRGDRRTVLAVATRDPAEVEGVPAGSRDSAAALWGRCVALLGALDESVCAGLVVADVAVAGG